jgi:Domain of unknown function (DUF397)
MSIVDRLAPPTPPKCSERPAQAPTWRKSSRSLSAGECVEMADLLHDGRTVGIRDSKDTAGPAIALSAARWRSLASQIKQGQHDLPKL